jgi:hypothetical protein
VQFILEKHEFPTREVFFDSLRGENLVQDTRDQQVWHQGVKLPSIFTAWQCGLISGADAEKIIREFMLCGCVV